MLHPRGRYLNSLFLLAIFFFVFGAMAMTVPPDLSAQSADDYFSRAINEYVAGNDREALSILDKALNVDPNHENALDLRQQIQNELPESKTEEAPSKDQGEPTQTSPADNEQGPGGNPARSPLSEENPNNGSSTEPSEAPTTSTAPQIPGEASSDTEDFSPLPEDKRREKSPEPPKLTRSPIETVSHVNDDFDAPDDRTESIHGITAKHFEDRVRYVIESSGTIDFIVSQIYDPPMLVVDLPNSVDQLPESPLKVGFPNNKRIRHSQYRIKPMNVTRVVFDLEEWTDDYQVYREPPGNRVIVDVYKSGESPDQQMVSGGQKGEQTGEKPVETDDAGRQTQTRDRTPTVQFETIRGDNQQVTVNQRTSDPLVASLTGRDGKPMSGKDVIYKVVEGKGTVDARPDQEGDQSRATTDNSGFTRAEFKAGSASGQAIVEAYVPSEDVLVEFTVDVKPEKPSQIVKLRGDRQETMFGRPVDESLAVQVLDRYGNPVPNVRVGFEDLSGQGFIDADLDADGIQRASSTNDKGVATLDLYRIPSNQTTNKVRSRVRRSDQDDLTTTFTVFGHAQLLSIDFKNANLQDVLRTLAEIAQWNIVLAEEVEGQPIRDMSVSVHLRDVTALKALDTILDVKGLSRVSDGNVMKIVPKQRAVRKGVPVLNPEELSEYHGNNMVTVTYQLTYLQVDDSLGQTIQQALMAENSSISAHPNSNSLTITDLANNQKRIKRILDNIDKPNDQLRVVAIPLEYKNSENMAQQLTDLLPLGENANIESNPRSNAILVYGDQTLIERIEKLVGILDKPGRIQENFKFLDMTGYDEEQIAQKVNTILGLRSVPVQTITTLDLDFENAEDALNFVNQSQEFNFEQILRAAKIIPLPRLNQILVFGPKDLRQTAVKVIEQLKKSQEGYLRKRNYRWYQSDNIGIQKVRDIVSRAGNVQIESELSEYSALLLASPSEESLDEAIKFLNRIDGKDIGPSRELIVYTPQFADPSQLANSVEQYFQQLEAAKAEAGDQISAPMPRVVHQGDQRIVFSVNSADRQFVEEMINKLDSDLLDKQSVLTYYPRFINADDLSNEIDDKNIGRLLYEGDDRISILVPKNRKEKYRKMLENIDSPEHSTQVVYLQHTRAEKILESLQTIQEDMDLKVSFSADPATNSIIFSAPQTSVDRVKNLISRLDRWQRQVFIEGIILEYTLDDSQEFQYQWFLNPNGSQINRANDVPPGEAGAQLVGAQGVRGTFTAILNENDFQSVLSVLANESQSEVLAKPQISAINNQQASIRVGDEQQIRVERQTEQGVVSSLQDVSAFTELNVTPTITADRHVLMDIVISSDQFTNPQTPNVQTQTTRRTTENTVMVQDGQTVVIGGLIEEESNESQSGVPYLKDVPFAGNLFSNESEGTSKRELVIFLTPHVIETPAESKRQAQQVSDQLRQITPMAVNVNIASQSKLARIQGLSPEGNEEQRRKIARKIVLHRETYGPFRDYSDLLKVQGITEDILDSIIYRIDYKVDVNTVSIDDLLRMKNINYDAAQSLIETRNQRGTFQSLNPVKKTLLEHGVSESYYETFLTPVFTVGGGGGNVSTGSREASQQNSSPLKQSEPTLRDSKDSESGDKQKEPSNSSLPDMNDL